VFAGNPNKSSDGSIKMTTAIWANSSRQALRMFPPQKVTLLYTGKLGIGYQSFWRLTQVWTRLIAIAPGRRGRRAKRVPVSLITALTGFESGV
jgi:hypothetical protein